MERSSSTWFFPIPSGVHSYFQYSKVSSASHTQQNQPKHPPTGYCFSAWSPEYLFSPQNPSFAKFIPQRSYLLLPVYLQLSSPAEAKLFFQHQPRMRLPGTRQGFIFPRQKHTFIKRHVFVHYSMHMHHMARISLILKTYSSCIMILHTIMFCLSGKDQYKNDYYQLMQFFLDIVSDVNPAMVTF